MPPYADGAQKALPQVTPEGAAFHFALHLLLLFLKLFYPAVNGDRRPGAGVFGQVGVFDLERPDVVGAVDVALVVAAAEDGAFTAVLAPAGAMVERLAAAADDRRQGVVVDVVLNRPGANGAVETKPVGLGNIVGRDVDWR